MQINLAFLLGLTLFKPPLPAKSSNILGIFPKISRSHHSFNQPIMKALAAKGHKITLLSYFNSTDVVPNYTEIPLQGTSEKIDYWIDALSIQDANDNQVGVYSIIKHGFDVIERASCEKVFALDYIKGLINTKGEKIDLIMAEAYDIQCYHLLAYKLNVPLILVVPLTPSTGVEHFIGNPFNPSVTPIAFGTSTPKMDFWQRMLNVIHYVMLHWYEHYKYKRGLEEQARRVFNMELPTDEELNRKTALVLYNNHFSFHARVKTPALIDVGGVHLKDLKPLPKDIEDFIEGSPHGVILFSFGSTIKASSIHAEKLKIILDVFSSIPQRVLWRVNELITAKLPPNVKMAKWLPQREILEHKNVIAFISHCGIMGTFETIHAATPVIAIPFAWDQFHISNILVEKNVAIYIDYFAMKKNTFFSAINEITTNTKYRENMQTLSKAFKDRPMSPLDEAVYWSEYVLKHKGAPQLRTVGADMPLYQYLLLDVILFLSSIILGLIYLLKWYFTVIIPKLCRQKEKKIKSQ